MKGFQYISKAGKFQQATIDIQKSLLKRIPVSGVTTGPADPASGGAAPLGGGILKICWKNWQVYAQFNDVRRTKNYIGA